VFLEFILLCGLVKYAELTTSFPKKLTKNWRTVPFAPGIAVSGQNLSTASC